jgi:quinol monooxygenase YgiN
VIWHVVRFDFSGIDDTAREEVEADLRALDRLDEVAWLRVARDVEEPTVTGLLTVFVDHEALEAYRVHPDHLPVVARVRELGVGTVRLDVATDDAVEALP